MCWRRKKPPSLKKIIVFEDLDYKDDMVIKFTDALKEGEKNLRHEEISARSASIKQAI